jgi:hypothetical protein
MNWVKGYTFDKDWIDRIDYQTSRGDLFSIAQDLIPILFHDKNIAFSPKLDFEDYYQKTGYSKLRQQSEPQDQPKAAKPLQKNPEDDKKRREKLLGLGKNVNTKVDEVLNFLNTQINIIENQSKNKAKQEFTDYLSKIQGSLVQIDNLVDFLEKNIPSVDYLSKALGQMALVDKSKSNPKPSKKPISPSPSLSLQLMGQAALVDNFQLNPNPPKKQISPPQSSSLKHSKQLIQIPNETSSISYPVLVGKDLYELHLVLSSDKSMYYFTNSNIAG